MNYITLMLVVGAMSCNTLANVALKHSTSLSSTFTTSFPWPINLLNLYSFLGICFFAFSLVQYVSVLHRIPLNYAQAIFALQCIPTILAAYFFMNEPINITRWIGIVIIVIGLIIVGLSEPSH